MRKFFIFAIALVAGVLAFTSCENNNANGLVGTWSRDSEKTPTGFYETQTLIIDGHNGFQFQAQQHDPEHPDFIAIMLMDGKYEVKGDIITVHYERHGWNYNGEVEYIPGWEGYDEKIKYSIDGNKLTIIRNYGEDYQNDPEVFTKQ